MISRAMACWYLLLSGTTMFGQAITDLRVSKPVLNTAASKVEYRLQNTTDRAISAYRLAIICRRQDGTSITGYSDEDAVLGTNQAVGPRSEVVASFDLPADTADVTVQALAVIYDDDTAEGGSVVEELFQRRRDWAIGLKGAAAVIERARSSTEVTESTLVDVRNLLRSEPSPGAGRTLAQMNQRGMRVGIARDLESISAAHRANPDLHLDSRLTDLAVSIQRNIDTLNLHSQRK